MFEQALSNDTKPNLAAVGKTALATQFYLAGGTALSLHLGHRLSYDLDFFTSDHFNIDQILSTLKSLGKVDISQATNDTFNGQLNGSPISFFIYPYPVLQPFSIHEGTQIASITDIAAMKVDAITRRGKKRDFIDLYFIAQHSIPLSQAMENYFLKFSGFNISRSHVIKSLSYFRDAEGDDMPEMIKPVIWQNVKKYFQKENTTLAKKFLK